jgi:hypothetical protein
MGAGKGTKGEVQGCYKQAALHEIGIGALINTDLF